MRLIDNILYLEFSEVVECGISEKYLWKAKSTGVKCWVFIKDPADNRRVMVQYETMKAEYKDKVVARYGNPYDRVSRTPILERVINDTKANDFFLGYRYNNNTKQLPIETVNKYTRMDAWLKYLGKLTLGDIKKGFGLTVPQFFGHVTELIKTEVTRGKDKAYNGIYMLPGDFPSSYQRLKTKADLYKNQTYADLIAPEYGNKNGSKIGKYEGGFCPQIAEQQMAVIRTIAAKHNNFDAGQVENFIKVIFQEKGWEPIKRSRLYQMMEEMKVQLAPGKRGRRSFDAEIAMQVKRSAPKHPLYFWTLDGWTVELLYQDDKGYNNRMVAVIVLDAFNKYPVGYAIGDREDTNLIKAANRNALLHINHLFGAYYKPLQVQSDNFGIKQMTPFYQAMSHIAYTPASVGNAKAKIIEPYFMYLNKRYCQQQANWSGFNVTASRENQVNAEFLNMIKTSFPNKEGVIEQIEAFIQRERSEKVDAFYKGWEAMPAEDKVVLSNEMEWLRIFGHRFGNPNSITGQGIIKTIAGVQYTYDSFDPDFRNNLHIKWNLTIDPLDMRKALAESEDGKMSFVLEEKMSIPMDLHSQTQEHHDYRKKITDFNKERAEKIMEQYISDAQIIDETFKADPLTLSDASEAAQKLLFTDKKGQQKDAIQDAKGLKNAKKLADKQEKQEEQEQAESWRQRQADFNRSKINLSEYIN